ncbi:hypothetical protein C0J52_04461 [Blattella germanica]|nr:hypothetical protein C0J52_04461 [Blattella germanica]
MATAVASRFAVLSIDDDDDFPKKNQKKKVENKKTGTGSSTQKTDSNQKKKNKKSESGKVTQPSSNNKTKGKSGKGEGRDGQKKKNVSQEQWDQWKKKDSEFVDGTYEQDLQQAILMSKLEYEEKKDFYDQIKKDAEEEKKNANKKNKKSNKAQTMSLEQFNNLHSESTCDVVEVAEPLTNNNKVNEQDEAFFERIKDDTKKALDREQTLELRKAREPFIQEAITIAQFEDTLEKRNKEIKSLKEEVVKLKEELHNVKTRNKKLCNILAQGESKFLLDLKHLLLQNSFV